MSYLNVFPNGFVSRRYRSPWIKPCGGEALWAFTSPTSFVLLATLAYLGSWQGKRKALVYGLSLGGFLLGCLSKETALAFLGMAVTACGDYRYG